MVYVTYLVVYIVYGNPSEGGVFMFPSIYSIYSNPSEGGVFMFHSIHSTLYIKVTHQKEVCFILHSIYGNLSGGVFMLYSIYVYS